MRTRRTWGGTTRGPATPAALSHRAFRRAVERRGLVARRAHLARAFALSGLLLPVGVGVGFLAPCTSSTCDDSIQLASELHKAGESFRRRHRRWPRTLEELAHPPRGRRILERVPLDPWGRRWFAFAVQRPEGEGFVVAGAGRDGALGTEDDVWVGPR